MMHFLHTTISLGIRCALDLERERDAEAHTFFEHLTKREICASDTQNDSEAEALPQLINALLDMVS